MMNSTNIPVGKKNSDLESFSVHCPAKIGSMFKHTNEKNVFLKLIGE